MRFDLHLTSRVDDVKCTGLVFKAKVENYLDSRDNYVSTNKMVLAKRLSCNCDKCNILYDCYIQSCKEGMWPILPTDMGHKRLYNLLMVNEHVDPYTGYVDDYDFTFVEIK